MPGLFLQRFTSVIALTIVVGGCSDRKLVPVELDQAGVVDDLVDIEADFCTRPVQDVTFPVKLLLVLDTSGSLQFTDQAGLRRAAVRELMNSLGTQNDLQVATLGFGSNINVDPPIAPGAPLFVPASQWVEPSFIGLADVQTNYHGALAAVKSHILRDLLESDPAEVSRTKYIIIFFSDGSPSPVCCINVDERVGELGEQPYGCAPEPYELAEAGITYCEGSEELALCNADLNLGLFREANTPKDDESPPRPSAPPDYGDGNLVPLNEFQSNDNYNRTYQIENLVTDIVDLGTEFGVGEMRFHTALLFDSNLDPAVKEIFRLNRCRSEGLLRSMAELGNGIYRDFENSEEIDFLSFNFTSLKQSFTLLRAYAQNNSALPPKAADEVGRDDIVLDFLPDSDADGIDDLAEQELGSDVAVRDSDKLATPPAITSVPEPIADPAAWGDGWNDKFEFDRIDVGFDPRFQSLPVDGCPGFDPGGVDRQDLDADGLNGCEEQLVQSANADGCRDAPCNRDRADSDGDGLSDGLEVRFGLNPRVAEGNRDDDFDGLPNADEVVRGLDPLLPDADRRERASVRYELLNLGDTDDGRTCYKSIARGVHLAQTAPRFLGGRSGYNDVLYWIAEAPSDAASRVELRVACHRAQYLKPSFKDPANGKITFVESDFLDLSNPADLQRFYDGEDVCNGLEVR